MEVITNRTSTELAVPESKAIWAGNLVMGGKVKQIFAVMTVDLAYFSIATVAGRKASEVVRTLGGFLPDAIWYFDMHCSAHQSRS